MATEEKLFYTHSGIKDKLSKRELERQLPATPSPCVENPGIQPVFISIYLYITPCTEPLPTLGDYIYLVARRRACYLDYQANDNLIDSEKLILP